MSTQQQMTGDDWIAQPSDRQMQQARIRRKKSGAALIKKLEAARDALYEFYRDCRDCNDGTGGETCGRDSRLILAADIDEYRMYLDSAVPKLRG